MTVIPIVIGALITISKGLIMGLVDLEIRGREEHSNESINKTSPNTEKSPGVLRRLAVTQTPVEDRCKKTLLIIIIINIEVKEEEKDMVTGKEENFKNKSQGN